MKKTCLTLTTILLCLAALSTRAIPVTGSIQFLGGATLNGPIDTATAFTGFTDPLFIPGSGPIVQAGSQSGSYASVPNGTATTWTPFSFAPGSASVVPLWTFTVGTTVYSFNATTINIDKQDSSILNLSGMGMAHIDGLEDTQGGWTITLTGGDATFTFGASSSVPDGTSTAVLLGAAVGMAAVLRQRFSSAV